MIYRSIWSVNHPRARIVAGGEVYNPLNIRLDGMTPRLWFQIECTNAFGDGPPYNICMPLDMSGLQPVFFNDFINNTLPAFAANCAANPGAWMNDVVVSIGNFVAHLNGRVELDQGILTAEVGDLAEAILFSDFILARHPTIP